MTKSEKINELKTGIDVLFCMRQTISEVRFFKIILYYIHYKYYIITVYLLVSVTTLLYYVLAILG